MFLTLLILHQSLLKISAKFSPSSLYLFSISFLKIFNSVMFEFFLLLLIFFFFSIFSIVSIVPSFSGCSLSFLILKSLKPSLCSMQYVSLFGIFSTIESKKIFSLVFFKSNNKDLSRQSSGSKSNVQLKTVFEFFFSICCSRNFFLSHGCLGVLMDFSAFICTVSAFFGFFQGTFLFFSFSTATVSP